MMKTKEKIKNRSRALFNSKGFKNVTLREVAKELSISYGNVTYHFKTKYQLILSLYEDMLRETEEILQTLDFDHLLFGMLDAPNITFEISKKYLFLYVDFIEIKRSYLDLSERLERDNNSRKQQYLLLLQQLRTQGILREDLTDSDLDYLMDLSGAMRTFFFINLTPSELAHKNLKHKYVAYVNRLVFPYLSKEGVKQYQLYLEKDR